jgi:drug/metabolite transporter (DMT)-like permease
MTVVRFSIAAALIILPCFWLKKAGFLGTTAQTHFKSAALPGFFLAGVIVLQAAGLLHTTATNSGFITCLYILFVPLTEALFFKKRLHPAHGLLVAVALIGTAFICKLNLANLSASKTLRGDVLTVIASLFATGQILAVGRASRKVTSVLAFNAYQSLWAALIALPFALALESGPLLAFERLASAGPLPLIGGMAYLIFGSTLIAFHLQVLGQKVLSPAVASMLFLLESPFAAFFAAVFLGERLDGMQWTGAALIFASAYGVVVLETKMKLPLAQSSRSH